MAGRPLSPRVFRPFGIEAVQLGPPVAQSGLVRRDGVALWRRIPEHAALFDRATGGHGGTAAEEVVAVRAVIATAPTRERSLRVPALGSRAERLGTLTRQSDTRRSGTGQPGSGQTGTAPSGAGQSGTRPTEPGPSAGPTGSGPIGTGAVGGLAPASGCLLLVDEGPGETWLYLASSSEPEAALAEFLGRRGRTDFVRVRRRARLGGLATLAMFAALALIFYGQALGLGAAGQIIGLVQLLAAVALLITLRPR